MAFLPISFGLFLLGNLVVTVPADADYSDLEDWEAPVNLTNGKVVVDLYTVADQCQPQPGYERLLINQLLFYLPKEGVCRDGFLICYYGQLGKEMSHLGHGLIPAIPYRMGNIRNNEVTKRCDRLRTQVLLECGDDTSRKCMYSADAPGKKLNSSWHGMLLRTDEDGNIIVQLSTSKESFKVPRKEFGEWLSLKLASFKHKISFFSRDTGPKRSFIDRKDGAELEEHRNQIHLPNDMELWKEYAKQRRKGAFLKKYAGIWSLGLDMLPTEAQDDEDGFWFHIQSPECCELKAWFLIPSAVKPEIAKKEIIPQINETGVKVNDSFKLEFEGRVNANAKEMAILFEAKHYNDSANFLESFKWIVDIVKQKANFYEETERSEQGHLNMQKAENTSNLAPGMLFNMNITFYTGQLVLEVKANCSSATFNFTLGKPINFEDYFNFKMHGDFVLYGEKPIFKCEPETTTTPSTSTSTTTNPTTTTPTTTTPTTTTTTTTTPTTRPPYKPFSFTMSDGESLVVRGKIPETSTNGFSLVFRRQIAKDSNVIALHMEVLLNEKKIKLSKEEPCFMWEKGCVNMKKNITDDLALEKFPNPGDNFEIFLFSDIKEHTADDKRKEVNAILHLWVQDAPKLWNFNYDQDLDEEAYKNKLMNFILEVKDDIAIETQIWQPNMGILGITNSENLVGIGYRKSIRMAQTKFGKALEIRAKQFRHDSPGLKETFAFYLTYDDGDQKSLIDYFNIWKVIPAGISVQFNEEGNAKMWLEYVTIGYHFVREEGPSESLIHLNEDFTIRFGIDQTKDDDNWLQVWVNDKWTKSIELSSKVVDLSALNIVSMVTKQDGTVLQQFPLKKEGLIYRGDLALLAEPDFK